MKLKKGKSRKIKKMNPLPYHDHRKVKKKKILEAKMAIICNQCQSITALTEGKNIKFKASKI